MKLRNLLPDWVKALFVRDIILVEDRSGAPLLTRNLDPFSLDRNGWRVLRTTLDGCVGDYRVVATVARMSVKQPSDLHVGVLDVAFTHRHRVRSHAAVNLCALVREDYGDRVQAVRLDVYYPSY
jgi:hypothetical protein